MRVLVTGASGFVGGHLCAHLVAQGHDVTAVVRRASSAPEGTTERLVGELGQSTDWSGVLTGHDAIIHLAARVHVMKEHSEDPLAEFRRVNVAGTAALVRAAVEQGVPRFVFLSSVKVYGEETTDEPLTVMSPTAPVDPYGISKLEAETEVRALTREAATSAVLIRIPLVYGPGVGGNFARILKLAKSGIPLPLAAVRNRRSMISVWNLVDLLERSASDSEAQGATVLAGDGVSPSTPELVRALRRAMNVRNRLFWFPVGLLKFAAAMTGMKGEVARLVDSLEVTVGSTTAWRWVPATTFESGIQKSVERFETSGVEESRWAG